MHNKEAIEMMRRSAEDIKQLRRRIDELAPKAEAFETLKKVLLVLLPSDRMGMGEDVVWRLENRIRELEKEEAEANKTAPKPFTALSRSEQMAAVTAKAAEAGVAAAELQDALKDVIEAKEAKASEREKAAIIAKAETYDDKLKSVLRPQGDELVDERLLNTADDVLLRDVAKHKARARDTLEAEEHY